MQSYTAQHPGAAQNIRSPIVGVLYACAVVYPVLLWWMGDGLRFIWDSHWYLDLARHLLAEQRYALESEHFHSKYPPGLPILISLSSLVSSNLEAAAGVVILAAVCLNSLLIAYLGSKKSFLTGVLACLIFNLHHLTGIHLNLLLTEQVFGLLSLSALAILSSRRRHAVASAAALAGAASMVRYEGLLLFPLLAYRFVAHRTEKFDSGQRLMLGLAVLLVTGAWGAWIASLLRHGAPLLGGAYSSELWQWTPAHALDFLLLGFWLGPLFLALACWGTIQLLAHKDRTAGYAASFCALYLTLHALWWFTDIRFYIPVLPWLCLAASHALVRLLHRWTASVWIRWSIAVLALGAFVAEQRNTRVPTEYEYRRFNQLYLTQYEPLRQLARQIPADSASAVYIVPDESVYRRYLPQAKLYSYAEAHQALEAGSGNRLFLILDNLHFKSEAFEGARTGQLGIDSADSRAELRTTLVVKVSAHETPDDNRAVEVYELLKASASDAIVP